MSGGSWPFPSMPPPAAPASLACRRSLFAAGSQLGERTGDRLPSLSSSTAAPPPTRLVGRWRLEFSGLDEGSSDDENGSLPPPLLLGIDPLKGRIPPLSTSVDGGTRELAIQRT